MSDGKGGSGHHDPVAGVVGAAPAYSALTLRIVLAAFGLLVCVLWLADTPLPYPILAALFALVALVDLVVVIRRKRSGEPG